MKKYNIIVALLGCSSSGKDTIARYLSNQGLKYVVSTTTRPMRSNEKQDIDYHFVSEKEFQALKDMNKFIEYRYYDTIQDGQQTRWHYGIERDEIDLSKHSYVCVVDVKGLEDLKNEFGDNILSFYIDVPYETRKIRAIARDRNFEEEEFERRNKDDEIRFENIQNKVNHIVRNDNLNDCISTIQSEVERALNMKKFFSQYASF